MNLNSENLDLDVSFTYQGKQLSKAVENATLKFKGTSKNQFWQKSQNLVAVIDDTSGVVLGAHLVQLHLADLLLRREHVDLDSLRGDAADRERQDARLLVRHQEYSRDRRTTKRSARDGSPDVRLVLVIRRNDLDLEIGMLLHEVLSRHLRRRDRALTGIVRIRARCVVEDADLHRTRRICQSG